MSIPECLDLVPVNSSCQTTSQNCHRRARYRSATTGRLLCGIHESEASASDVLLCETPETLGHRRTVNRAAFATRTSGQRGRVRLATNNKWNYSPFVPGSIGIRLREMFGEQGTPVLRQFLFENCGPVQLGTRTCPSLEHMVRLCALYDFEFGDKISERFWARLDSGFSDPRLPSPRLPQSVRCLAQKYSASDALPRLYVNLSGEGNKIMTAQQFRALLCSVYEGEVLRNPAFLELRRALADGYSFVIWTREAIFHDSEFTDLQGDFMNNWQPFTEEFAFVCMLMIDNPLDYPWNVYRRQNAEIFDLSIPK